MDYNSYVASLASIMVIEATEPDFLTQVPNAIDFGELRCYFDLNLLNTGYRDGTAGLAPGDRNFAAPTPPGGAIWLSVDSANVITPGGVAPDSGTRVPLLKANQQFIDFIGSAAATGGRPRAYAMITDTTLIVGPFPDAAYRMELVGTTRPAPLTAVNPTTLLTTFFPSLFLAASMIYMSGYQKNYGAQADDPKMATSWEAQYKAQLNSAETEEARKKANAFTGRTITGTPRAA